MRVPNRFRHYPCIENYSDLFDENLAIFRHMSEDKTRQVTSISCFNSTEVYIIVDNNTQKVIKIFHLMEHPQADIYSINNIFINIIQVVHQYKYIIRIMGYYLKHTILTTQTNYHLVLK